jgi:succinate-semialdehyde dehydrogenase/glutarate-semialdehyde dehydrogenase
MKVQAAKTQTGNGMSAATTHGPLANANQLAIVERLVDEARQRGATIETGGHRVGSAAGYAYARCSLLGQDVALQ